MKCQVSVFEMLEIYFQCFIQRTLKGMNNSH